VNSELWTLDPLLPSIYSLTNYTACDRVHAVYRRWTALHQSECPGTELLLTPLEATLTRLGPLSPLLATLPRIVTFRYV